MANDIIEVLGAISKEVTRSLPAHIKRDNLKIDRFKLLVKKEVENNPKLLGNLEALKLAIMTCAQYGLAPGSAGKCYIIPYGNKATFILGYKGMIELALRNKNITSIRARAVHENDLFNVSLGTHDEINHIPVFKDKGEAIAYYSVITYSNGQKEFEVMGIDELNKIRDTSSGYKNSRSSPWHLHLGEMYKKTILRRHLKTTPLETDLTDALEDEYNENNPIKDVTPLEPEKESITVDEQVDQLTGEMSAPAKNKSKDKPSIDEMAIDEDGSPY